MAIDHLSSWNLSLKFNAEHLMTHNSSTTQRIVRHISFPLLIRLLDRNVFLCERVHWKDRSLIGEFFCLRIQIYTLLTLLAAKQCHIHVSTDGVVRVFSKPGGPTRSSLNHFITCLGGVLACKWTASWLPGCLGSYLCAWGALLNRKHEEDDQQYCCSHPSRR